MATQSVKLPKRFELLGSEWKVEEVVGLPVLGETHRDTLTIKLRKELSPTVKATTFYHELVHAMLFAMGKTEHSEEQVDLMGALLHQFEKTKK